jgi:uncharacterized protein YjbI with pentapeptide repeats
LVGEKTWTVFRELVIGIAATTEIWIAWIRSNAEADQAAGALASNRTELLNAALQGLGSERTSQRVAAVRILVDLTRQDFSTYVATVILALAGLVRETADDEQARTGRIRSDAQLAVRQIATYLQRHHGQFLFIEDQSRLPGAIDFSNAYLPGLQIDSRILENTVWKEATIDGARIRDVGFTNANFAGESIRDCILVDNPRHNRPFDGVDFEGADISGTHLGWSEPALEDSDFEQEATKLRQTLIEVDKWDDANPPDIRGEKVIREL